MIFRGNHASRGPGETDTKNAPACLVLALLLSACSPDQETGEIERLAQPVGESPQAPPSALFTGRWASDAAACRTAPWLITEDGLQTPGEVACRFEEVRRTRRGAEADAVCVAEGPPQRWRIQFAFAESARALLIEDAPFADTGLVRCEEAVPGKLMGALSANGVKAANVVEAYFALLSEGRVEEAQRFHAIEEPVHDELARRLAGFASDDIAVGPAGRVEGAAGSLYVNVPVSVHGRDTHGMFGNVTLRRSNNVPGATPEQLSWRIVRIEWQSLEGE